jgi:hypothetical protein
MPMLPPRRRHASSTRPEGGVYLIALRTRLLTMLSSNKALLQVIQSTYQRLGSASYADNGKANCERLNSSQNPRFAEACLIEIAMSGIERIEQEVLMLNKAHAAIVAALVALPHACLAADEPASACVDVSGPKSAIMTGHGRWIELTSAQWQFLRGIYVVNPNTPPGLPYGSGSRADGARSCF